MPPRQLVIALIGDLNWESSAEHYRISTRQSRGRQSGRCLMQSFDFGEIETLHAGGFPYIRRAMGAWSQDRGVGNGVGKIDG
jgi:hypothetical protein